MSLLPPPLSSVPSVTGMTDLLVRVRDQRDRRAFITVFEHFAPRLKSYMLKLGMQGGVAEDLAQEVMLSVWRKAHLFDPTRANASTWIYTIARNLRIDHLRREKHPALEPEDAMILDQPASADTLMMIQESDLRLRQCLASLSAEQQEVVTMSFYEDAPHAVIASRLKIPLGTVKSRLRLALKHIRRQLGEDES